MRAFLLSLVCFLSLCLPGLAQSQIQDVYEPGTDPVLGFNICSFLGESEDKLSEHYEGVDTMELAGVRHASFCIYRRFDSETGSMIEGSGPTILTMRLAMRRAKQLGFQITITPIFEMTGDQAWRGDWNPVGQANLQFKREYFRWMYKLSRIAEVDKVHRLNIGTELQQFVRNPKNEHYLKYVMRVVRSNYSGKIGYVSTLDNYRNDQVKKVFWDSPEIDAISLSIYPHWRLASIEESDDSHLNPFFDIVVQDRWKNMFQDEILPYARTLRQGSGMPVVVAEFGAVPYNRTATIPWSFSPGTFYGASDEEDVDEQTAVIMGLIRATNGMGNEIEAINIWTWSFNGHYDRYGINPFHNSIQKPTADLIMQYYLSQPVQ